MRIRWTPPAAADLESINEYLRAHRPHQRLATIRKIYKKIRNLTGAPYIGRPGRVPGTREVLFLPMPYIAVYRIKDETIEALRIYHRSQDRP